MSSCTHDSTVHSVNVIGYLKTVLVIVGGFVLFGEEITAQKGLGILIVLAGLAWYTYEKATEQAQTQQQRR